MSFCHRLRQVCPKIIFPQQIPHCLANYIPRHYITDINISHYLRKTLNRGGWDDRQLLIHSVHCLFDVTTNTFSAQIYFFLLAANVSLTEVGLALTTNYCLLNILQIKLTFNVTVLLHPNKQKRTPIGKFAFLESGWNKINAVHVQFIIPVIIHIN